MALDPFPGGNGCKKKGLYDSLVDQTLGQAYKTVRFIYDNWAKVEDASNIAQGLPPDVWSYNPANFATAAQGLKADSAVQPAMLDNYVLKVELGTYALKSELADYALKTELNAYALTSSLGSAASKDVTFFATAVQGAKADTAVQPAALANVVLKTDLAAASGSSMMGHRHRVDTQTRTAESKLREMRRSIVDHGGSTAGNSATNRAALAEALSKCDRGEELFIPPGQFNISDMPPNPNRARLVGPGTLVAPVPVSQVNTYRYDKPISINKEYLWRVYQVLDKTNREIRCVTYGDSTVEGGMNYVDWSFFLQNLLPDMASALGVQNKFSVTNRGVGGSNLSTWNPTPDVGVNTATPADLVILKCGINDAFGTDRLEVFEQRLRDGLAAIRATNGGGIGDLAILLVGPNAVWDMEFDSRNTRWFEALRPIFEAAARDYKCAYFDSYAYLQDASFATGRWLDAASNGSGTGLHPTNVGQSWIWGGVMDFIFSGSELLRYKTNQMHNYSQYRSWRSAKNPPDFYPANYAPGITMEIALAVDGFPFTGYIHTDKHADGYIVQRLTPVDGSFKYLTRVGSTQNGWSGWRGSRADLTYSNGWANFGGVFRSGAVTITSEGLVALSGVLKPGTLTSGTVIANLPSAYRPVNQHLLLAATDTGTAVLEILASGDIQIKSATGTPTYLSLSGLSFFA